MRTVTSRLLLCWSNNQPALVILGLFLGITILWLLNAFFVISNLLDFLLSFLELSLGFILLPIALIYGAMRRWSARHYSLVILLCIFWIGWAFIGDQFFWITRYAGLERASHRADPLINAIERYTKDYGVPPRTLLNLVPYYILGIPDTGLPAYPYFKYRNFLHRGSSGWNLFIGEDTFNGLGDTFFYSWDQNYSSNGLHIVRVGKWAYFHQYISPL